MSAALTLPLFADLDIDAPSPPPRPRTLTPRPRHALAEQLPLRVHLPVVQPDLYEATRGLCLAQHDECEETDCRHHIGAIRTYLGESWGCAIAVATAFSQHGLAPVAVAALLDITESEAQKVEHVAKARVREEVTRLSAEEDEDARRARIRERLKRIG